MGSLTKALIGKEDLEIQYNTNATEHFTRLASGGSSLTLHKFPDIWDGTGKVAIGALDLNGNTIYLNKDYVAGDEDCTIDFSNNMATMKLEYSSTELGIRQFTISERARIGKTFNSAADYDVYDVGWAFRVGVTADFDAWALGTNPSLCGWFEMDNQINSSTPEVAAISAFTYNVHLDSCAQSMAADFLVVKAAPCVTDINCQVVSAILCSDVTPTLPIRGCGVKSQSSTMTGYAGAVQQHSAFYSCGDKGWFYHLYCENTAGNPVATIDDDGIIAGLGYTVVEIAVAPTAVVGQAQLYTIDNGAGLMKLMVLFPTGVAQQLAIEA